MKQRAQTQLWARLGSRGRGSRQRQLLSYRCAKGVSSKSSSGSNQTTRVGVLHQEPQESPVLLPGLRLPGGSGGQVGKGLAMQLDNQPAEGPLGTIGP